MAEKTTCIFIFICSSGMKFESVFNHFVSGQLIETEDFQSTDALSRLSFNAFSGYFDPMNICFDYKKQMIVGVI